MIYKDDPPASLASEKGRERTSPSSGELHFPTPSIDEAQAYLDVLGGDEFLFQTYRESGARGGRLLLGSLSEHSAALSSANAEGYAVAVTINRTAGKERKKASVIEVRALALDLDGSPLDPVRKAGLHPSLIVETSPGKFHCLWPVADVSLEEFGDLQRALARRFDGDVRIADLPRVLRLPGFYHHKRSVPFRSRLLHADEARPRFRKQEIIDAFSLVTAPLAKKSKKAAHESGKGKAGKPAAINLPAGDDAEKSPAHEFDFSAATAIHEGRRNEFLFQLGVAPRERRR